VPVVSCGRSLYIDWRVVVVIGGMSYSMLNGRGNCPGGEMSGEYVRGENVQGESARA